VTGGAAEGRPGDGRILGGRYRLLDVLGSGGMATVYRGRDELLAREVAVKVFNTESTDPADLKRRQSEMLLLAGLNHSGLVLLYDAGAEQSGGRDGVDYLVMEYVAGSDLHRRLLNGPLSHAEALRLASQMAASLQVIHARGIVHRDIKPANILLPTGWAEGTVSAKLTDFGIAQPEGAERVTVAGTTVGTAAYLSPEQALGQGTGAPTDIYSLGLVLLEALTGRTEFPGSPVESAAARLARDPDVPESLGSPWAELLPAMTSRDPAARPSAADISGMLSGGTSGLPAPTRTMPARPAAARPAAAPAVPAVPSVPAGVADRRGGADRPVQAPGPGQGLARPALARPDTAQLTNATLRGLPAPPPRPPAAEPRKPAWRNRRNLLLAAGAALAGLVLVTALTIGGQQSTPVTPQPSPTVSLPADVEEHLQQLEEKVTP
jgi:hypothetical protein